MTQSILGAAALFAAIASPAAAQGVAPLSLEDKTLVRCSAAFAMAAKLDGQGDASLGAIPDLHTRGREYFVQAMAALMDKRQLGRDAVVALLEEQVAELSVGDTLARAMPACLVSLETSKL